MKLSINTMKQVFKNNIKKLRNLGRHFLVQSIQTVNQMSIPVISNFQMLPQKSKIILFLLISKTTQMIQSNEVHRNYLGTAKIFSISLFIFAAINLQPKKRSAYSYKPNSLIMKHNIIHIFNKQEAKELYDFIINEKLNYFIKSTQHSMIDSRDKQVIKNIQAKAEIINKQQEKASKVLVLSMGSYSIKMGFANERVPFTIKPCIAYKKTPKALSQDDSESQQLLKDEFDFGLFKKQYSEIESHLKNEGVISSQHRPAKGKPRGKQNVLLNAYPQLNQSKDILFSDQALAVQNCSDYIFRKPIKHGQFNISNTTNDELQSCLNDIEHLLKYMLKQKLKIPEKQWILFSCIIVVPDVFIRQHIKYLVSMVFGKICFNKLYIHLQSVLACLGTAISSAVVVDVGHEKINVCCVDQGIILPKTLIRKNFGLKHVSKTMIRLFNNKINEEGYDLSTSLESDLGQVDQIKQIACTVKEPEQQQSNKVYQVRTFRNKKQTQIPINYSDVMCISANSIFFKIWNAFPFSDMYYDAFNSYSELYDLQQDPEDMFQQFSGGGHVYEIQQDNPNYSRDISNPYVYQPLEQIVAASLLSIKDNQARKKFFANILVIGGGGLVPQLSDQLISRLNRIFDNGQSQDKIESAADIFVKEINLSFASWLGGTVLPKLDSLRDLWIQRSKYTGCLKQESNEVEQEGALDKKLFTRKQQSQQWGIRYLKQKIPFLW